MREDFDMKIPAKVKIKRGVYYKVLWQEIIADDHSCMGITIKEDRTIIIKIGMSNTDTAKTFIHELIHAIEFEYNEPIPERIVYALDEGIFKVLKLNKWL
jgi:hypothetical protein